MHPTLKNDIYPLMKLATPLVLTRVGQSSVFFFETFFLSQLGTDILAAGALVGWLFGTFSVILFGTLSSVNVLVAHQYGANDKLGISLIIRDGLILAIIIGILAFLLFWNISSLFILFRQDYSLIPLAKAYLHALAWGLLPNFLMIIFLEFLIGIGHTRIVTIILLLSTLFTVVFSYALIFGKFGLPFLGIAGAGWGITVSCWLTSVILIIYIITEKKYRIYFYNIFSIAKPSYSWELLRIGFPMGTMYCIEMAFFFAMTLVMGTLDKQMLVANQIVLQYMGVLMAILFSIAQAITVRMGHLIGEKNSHSAQKVSAAGICLSVTLMCAVALFYWLSPHILISLDFDINDPMNFKIVQYGIQFFGVCGIFLLLEAIRTALFGALRGLKDTRTAFFVSIVGFWCIAFPVGLFLCTYVGLSGVGLWWGMVLGANLSTALLYMAYRARLNQYITYEITILKS